jgi:hypothetical protein
MPEQPRQAEPRVGLWVDAVLKEEKERVDEVCRKPFAAKEMPAGLIGPDLEKIVELLRGAAQTEFEREQNLNTRAATVAAVAGLIVTASAAVGKSVFGTETGGTVPLETLAFFLVGLVAVVAAMIMVVFGVLRPKQAPTRQMFFTDTLVGVWTLLRGPSAVLRAKPECMYVVLADRLLRTLAVWSVRNREKARWLRRAWVFLAFGVALIGVAGLLVLSKVLEEDYSLPGILAIVGVGILSVWVVLQVDSWGAERERRPTFKDEECKRWEELKTVAKALDPSSEPAIWWSQAGGESDKSTRPD